MMQPLMKVFLVSILITCFISPGFSQHKFEKESRVHKTEVPKNAVNLVDSMLSDIKIKWYKETGYNKKSYEAKTKYKKKKLSIEFSENGSFEDLEVEIKSKKIPLNTYKKITALLAVNYEKYSFEKTQIQYLGNPVTVLRFFINKENERKGIVKNYEIVISAKIDGSYTMFEYLFNENGEFLQKSRILLKMTDNIEY